MDLEQAPAAVEAAAGAPLDRPRLTVLAATEEELAEHAGVLQDIQKQSKGKCVWLKLEGEAPGAA